MTIFEQWSITASELTDLVRENPSLRGIMLGYVAEHKFRQLIEQHPQIAGSRKYDDHDRTRKSDRVILYKRQEFSIEVKSLQTNLIQNRDGKWFGRAQVDASDRRVVTLANGKKLNTTLLLRGQFDILAVNCFAFENKWHFAFAAEPGSAHVHIQEVHESPTRTTHRVAGAGFLASRTTFRRRPVPPG